MAPDEPEDPPVAELLDRLPGRVRTALEASGFDLPRLRTLASPDPGARQVRHIITEFGGATPRRSPRHPRLICVRGGPTAYADPRPHLATHWLLLILGTTCCTVAVVICDVLADRPLGLLVAAAAWIGLLVLILTGPVTRHQVLVVALGAATCATLLFGPAVQIRHQYVETAPEGRGAQGWPGGEPGEEGLCRIVQTCAYAARPPEIGAVVLLMASWHALVYSEQLFDLIAKIAELLRLERK